jgi:hypothetical protein
MTWRRRLAMVAALVWMFVTLGCRKEKNEDAATTMTTEPSAEVYACRQTSPLDAGSVWPIPRDAEVTASGVHTKQIQAGNGRTPVVGSGQVLVLCITYYDRKGAVVQHDPVVVHDIDLDVPEWQDVLRRMSEREIRRFWIPPRRHIKEMVIGDFEMQPFPEPDPLRKPPESKAK